MPPPVAPLAVPPAAGPSWAALPPASGATRRGLPRRGSRFELGRPCGEGIVQPHVCPSAGPGDRRVGELVVHPPLLFSHWRVKLLAVTKPFAEGGSIWLAFASP